MHCKVHRTQYKTVGTYMYYNIEMPLYASIFKRYRPNSYLWQYNTSDIYKWPIMSSKELSQTTSTEVSTTIYNIYIYINLYHSRVAINGGIS